MGLVGALGLCLPAWHVVTALLSDSYMTLYAGRWIAQHGIPHHEVFTLGAQGRPWVDQQWLAELIDYETWRAGSYALLGVVNGLVIAAAYAGLAAICLRRGASAVITLACCAVAMVVALPGMFIRAQDLALPLFVIGLALCLTDAEQEQPRLWIILVVPLLILWANLHGSVLLGAGLIALYLLSRGASMASRGDRSAARRYWVLAALAAATPLATPYGLHIASYYRDLIGNPGVAAAAPENRPPTLAGPQSLSFFILLGLTAVGIIASRLKHHRVSPPLVVAVLITAAATIAASRNAVWFAMVFAVLAASSARDWLPAEPPTRGFIVAMTAAAGAIAAIGVSLLVAPNGGGYEKYTPLTAISAAATYAEAHPGTHILGDNAASSALLWHDPQLDGRVGYDARLERYSTHSLDSWIAYQAAEGPEWRATTRGFQLLIGSTKYNPALVHRLVSAPAITPLAHDERGIAVVNQ